MKKILSALIAILMLLPLTGCVDRIKDAINPPKAEKPVIYLYPEENKCDGDESSPEGSDGEITYYKPVDYLYPTSSTEVSVKLDYNGTLTSTYPKYNDGWTVLAHPDGTLIDPATGREYYCLFWEGVSDVEYDLSKGFVISGEDTASFLEESLEKLGLNQREINEFIIYWLPRMEVNPYNLITFQNEIYTENAKLTVTPTPDTMIRVFMVWKSLDAPIEIEEQDLSAPEREGFTVVEWGGAEIE